MLVDTSISGLHVARELDRIADTCGYPCMVASDNGTELTSNAILKWQEERRVGAPHRPGHADAERLRGELQCPAP
jgi:putative transposase